MFVGNPLENRSRQPLYDDPEIRAKVKAKLKNVIEKGYIEMVDIKLVEALMFMFLRENQIFKWFMMARNLV